MRRWGRLMITTAKNRAPYMEIHRRKLSVDFRSSEGYRLWLLCSLLSGSLLSPYRQNNNKGKLKIKN
jgi:hypothetical protein